MQPTNHPSDRAQVLNAARRLQADMELILRNERSEQDFLAKLQNFADEQHDLAKLWEDAGDAQMAEQVRKEEEQTRALIDKVTQLAGKTADEAEKVQGEIRVLLSRMTPK